ncbi:hypothetical protein XENTR_v10011340 [Xenopus tropicalis]|nr:hypothetical protein XENTR_v10011340 [Xenopus tropicalis]
MELQEVAGTSELQETPTVAEVEMTSTEPSASEEEIIPLEEHPATEEEMTSTEPSPPEEEITALEEHPAAEEEITSKEAAPAVEVSSQTWSARFRKSTQQIWRSTRRVFKALCCHCPPPSP